MTTKPIVRRSLATLACLTALGVGAAVAQPAEATTREYLGPAKATFTHFTVQVGGQAPVTPTKIAGKDWVWVKVCARSLAAEYKASGSVPVSLAPWSVKVYPGNRTQAIHKTGRYAPAYPTSARLKPGQCAAGFITFTSPKQPVDSITARYSNSLGNKATWNFH